MDFLDPEALTDAMDLLDPPALTVREDLREKRVKADHQARTALPVRTDVLDSWDRRVSQDTVTPARRETEDYRESGVHREKRVPRENGVLQHPVIFLGLYLDLPDLRVLAERTVSTVFRVLRDGTDFPAEKESLGLKETRETRASQACQAQEVFLDREEKREKQDPWDSPEKLVSRVIPVSRVPPAPQAPPETPDFRAPVYQVSLALQVTKEQREKEDTQEHPATLASPDYRDSPERKVTPVFPACPVFPEKKAAREMQLLRGPLDLLDLPVSLDLWDPKAIEDSQETPETRASRVFLERRAREDSPVFLDFRVTTDNQECLESQERTAPPASQGCQARRVTGEPQASPVFLDSAALTASPESRAKRETLVSPVPLGSTEFRVFQESRASRVSPVHRERKAFPESPPKREREDSRVSLAREDHLDHQGLQASMELWDPKEMLVCLVVACLVFKACRETRETTVTMDSQDCRVKRVPRVFPDSQGQKEIEATRAFLANQVNKVVTASPATPD